VNGKLALFLSILFSISLLVVGYGCRGGAPAEEKYVTFLDIADLTGVTAGGSQFYPVGLGYYFRMLNEQGGVEGVKIKHIVVDTRYDTARAMTSYRRYHGEHKVLVVRSVSTPQGKILEPIIAKDHIVGLAPPDGEMMAKPGWTFIWFAPYQNQYAAAIDFVIQDWKAKGLQGVPVMGGVFWDNQAGRETANGGPEYGAQLEAQGKIKVLPQEFIPIAAPEVTAYLARIEAAGANYCMIFTGPDPAGTLVARDAYKMGLNSKMTFIQGMYGPDLQSGLKSHPEAVEGSYIISPFIRGEEFLNYPLTKTFSERYADGAQLNEYNIFGYVFGNEFENALKIALDAVGYEKLDGVAMFDAYKNLTGVSYDGMIGPEDHGYEFSETGRSPSSWCKMYKIVGGEVTPYSDWFKATDVVPLHQWN